MSQSAFVIGGRGFVGAPVVRGLVQSGWDVTVFDPAPANDRLAALTALHCVDGSVTDPAALRKAVAEAEPHLIVSFAAFGESNLDMIQSAERSPQDALAVNVAGFWNTLDTARSAGVRRVLWSSSAAVYGPEGEYAGRRVSENDQPSPRTVHGATKVMAEQITTYFRARHGLQVCGVRLPLVIGPGCSNNGAASAIMELYREAHPGAQCTVRASGDRVDLIYVQDVTELFLRLAAEKAALDAIYNAGGFTASIPEMAVMLARLVPGYRPQISAIQPPLVYPLIDDSRLRSRLGWQPRYDLLEASRDYLAAEAAM